MNRRSVLQLGGMAFVSTLTGCSTVVPEEPITVSVSEIEIRNYLDREIDVSVLLLDDGEIAVWKTVTVPTSPNPGTVINDLPSDAGEYTMYAQLPTVADDSPVRADLTEDASGQSCITVHMDIRLTGSADDERPTVVYGAIGTCRESD